MSGRSHNKKRNTGLLYEFLIRSISEALVKNDAKKSNHALKLIRRHFKPGTELYKELRLINALARTTVTSEHVAASILNEARMAARSYDTKALDREKSLLISAINKSINDDNFYDAQVNEYRVLATIQTLLNDWRVPDADLSRVAQYEDQLIKWLLAPKDAGPGEQLAEDSATGTSRLLMKLMMKKLNEKYAGALSDEQKQLLRAYAFSTANDDPNSIRLKLQEIKDKLLREIDEYGSQTSGVEYVGKKLAEARRCIASETLSEVNDDTVTRFMLYTKLNAELTSEET